MAIEDDIRKACAILASVAPFCYPLMVLPIIKDDKMPADAATNGISLIINPERWVKLTFREQSFVLMHEWLHIAFMHAKRSNNRNPRIHNYASDFVINHLIISTMGDHFDAPKLMLHDPWVVNKHTSEEMYNKLLTELDKRRLNGYKPVCRHCSQELTKEELAKATGANKCPVCGSPTDKIVACPQFINFEDSINFLMADVYGAPWGNDIIPMPSGADEGEIIDQVIKAAARAKGLSRGLLPGFFEDYVNSLKKSEISWTRILDRYMKTGLKGTKDRNPYKPDPKYLPFDIIVPTEQGGQVPKLVIIVDTSGSMGQTELQEVLGHLEKLHPLCASAYVIEADTQVTEIVKLRSIRNAMANKGFRFKGRGGTYMAPAVEVADKLKPDLILLISDMYIGEFPPKPRADIIFIATESSTVKSSPYGVFVKVNKVKG